MRLFYAGDIHGSDKLWLKFLNAPKLYGVDTLIMGGDITGKVMVPEVAAGGRAFEARLAGRRELVEEKALPDLEKRIRFNGFYPYRCDHDEYLKLKQDSAYR